MQEMAVNMLVKDKMTQKINGALGSHDDCLRDKLEQRPAPITTVLVRSVGGPPFTDENNLLKAKN